MPNEINVSHFGFRNTLYYLILQADINNYVTESNEGNNTTTAAVPVTVTAPELVPGGLGSDATAVSANSLRVWYSVTNMGNGAANAPSFGYWWDQVTLSTNPSLAGAVTAWSFRYNGSEAAGAVYTVTNTVNLPALAPGNSSTALATLRHVSRIAAQAAAQVGTCTASARHWWTPKSRYGCGSIAKSHCACFRTHFPRSQTYTGV
jgi:hypothetical protein